MYVLMYVIISYCKITVPISDIKGNIPIWESLNFIIPFLFKKLFKTLKNNWIHF